MKEATGDIEICDLFFFEGSHYPLSVLIDPGEELTIRMNYDTHRFNDATIVQILKHFKTLLEAFTVNPHQPLSAFSILTAKETQKLLEEFNQTTVSYPTDKTLVQLFEAQVAKTPDSIAVQYDQDYLTYARLNRRANQLAHFLQKVGVGPETLVGVFMERSLEMVISLFGILKAGGAYIPLDPNHPSERIGFMLADGQVSIMLTQKSVLNQLPEHQADTFCLDSDWYTIAQENSQNPTHIVGPNNLAYVIYTSGSTGEPKGVMIEHKNVVNLVTGLHHRIYSKYLTGLNVALVAPYVFDASVQQIFAALLLGHSLHIVPEEARLDGRLLFQFYQTHQIDVSDGTPAHLDLIANSISNRPRLNVQHFIIGGEALLPQTVQRFFDTFEDGSFKITNIYGPAECCVDSIAYELAREDIEQLINIPIGTPMPNEQVHILNEAKALQPIGMPGEICISGDGVGRGYLNRDDLTAEKFIESPFQLGDKLYCTGDIGRYLPDGRIEFIGRKDTQVKIRGYRIELGEIENRLKQFKKKQEHLKLNLAQTDSPLPAQTSIRCRECLLTTNHPGVQINENGICNICRQFDVYGAEIRNFFRPFNEFKVVVEQARQTSQSEYDCLLLYSGGKDSSYVLHHLVEMGLKVLAYTFDNGFISAAAFKNIKRQTSQLNVDTVITKADAMNEIFVESLMRDSTVCSGCFRALTAHSTRLAQEKGINVVITGLSRGQIFDTKLAGMFDQGIYDVDEIEAKLLLFRKMYHSNNDRTASLLDVDLNDTPFDQMHFIDFFRYDDTPVHQIRSYLQARDNYWTQPQDTGFCSSNCMMNDIGIGVHSKERGYHNYDAPLSWDIRLGIVTREDGLKEVEYQLDERRLNNVLDQIGYFTTQIRDAAVVDRVDDAANKYLCAYYVASKALTVSELRAHLQQTLPDYMIPSRFVRVNAIPLTHNGKVDRRALPVPGADRPELDSAYVAPNTRIEAALTDIWTQTLKVDRVGIHDNFFDLGGDSIISLQIVAKASQAGLRLIPQQLFEYQTIAELSSVVDIAESITAEQGLISGTVPLTPIQHWFFEQSISDRNYWNQSVMIDVLDELNPKLLEQAVQQLPIQHDALRLQFLPETTTASPKWKQSIIQTVPTIDFEVIDISTLPHTEQQQIVDTTISRLEAGHNLGQGKLIKAAYFKLGLSQPNRLFITIHHLAVDGISWSILLQDIETVYTQLVHGKSITLPAKTTSFKAWAEKLNEFAQTEALRQELDYWTAVSNEVTSEIPIDTLVEAANTEMSARTISVSLTLEETLSLLKDLPSVYHTQINDALLTALAQTIAAWANQTTIFISLEGHGREEIIKNVDLTRTSGWFTTIFPTKLTLHDSPSPSAALKSIKEQLRRIPNRGIGYGLLRYLCQDEAVTTKLATLPKPQILFNYLGQFDRSLPDSALFKFTRPLVGAHSPEALRSHLLVINMMVISGCLRMDWTFSQNIYRHQTIQQLADNYAEALRTLIAHVLSPDETRDFTPSDFPLANLDEDKISQLANILNELE